MKNLSRGSKVVVAAVIAVTGIVAFHAFADKPASIEKAKVKRSYNGRQLKAAYQDVQKFKQLLDANEAIYCLKVRMNPGQEEPLDNGGGHTASSTSGDDATRDVSFACYSSHVTQQAAFNTDGQATNVDGAFQ